MKITKTYLRQIIKEEIQKIDEGNKFTVTINDRFEKEIDKQSFDDKNSAKKFTNQMIKKYKLTRQRGFWGNSKTGIELTQNF